MQVFVLQFRNVLYQMNVQRYVEKQSFRTLKECIFFYLRHIFIHRYLSVVKFVNIFVIVVLSLSEFKFSTFWQAKNAVLNSFFYIYDKWEAILNNCVHTLIWIVFKFLPLSCVKIYQNTNHRAYFFDNFSQQHNIKMSLVRKTSLLFISN